MRICIDAGHGGLDSGAVNGKIRESDINLSIALKLEQMLLALDHVCYLTRRTDKALQLKERCDISAKHQCDIFVSIHCNSVANKTVTGIETFKAPKVTGLSKTLADSIQKTMIKGLPHEKNRGVKEAPFFVLVNTKAPAVLVEVGFISNDSTAKQLEDEVYQQRLAGYICAGIVKAISK